MSQFKYFCPVIGKDNDGNELLVDCIYFETQDEAVEFYQTNSGKLFETEDGDFGLVQEPELLEQQ